MDDAHTDQADLVDWKTVLNRTKQPGTKNPDHLEVELDSANAAGLFRALAHRHGDPIASAAKSMKRLFLLRAPWAPGLRFAGGIAEPLTTGRDDTDPLAGDQEMLHLAGGGTTIQDALASCAGEAVERLSQQKRPGDVVVTTTLDEASKRMLPAMHDCVARLCSHFGYDKHKAFDWLKGRCISTKDTCLVPADWCLRTTVDGPLRVPGTALSTGVAAGPTFEAAACRAVLELIERDAVALWWIGGRRARALTMDAATVRTAHESLNTLRQGNQDRVTWMLDLTTDLNVPVIAALSTDPNGYGLACGFGARLSVQDAAKSAVLELCQMELALNIAVSREAAKGSETLTISDLQRLALARELDTSMCELLHPIGSVATRDVGDGNVCPKEQLSLLLQHVSASEIEVALVNLTRPEFGVPVVASIAPDLQALPSQITTRRLQEKISETGGGARYTHGLALL